jgi:CHAT domain-containing protein/tetratricopeptide (TPR) repeat protein
MTAPELPRVSAAFDLGWERIEAGVPTKRDMRRTIFHVATALSAPVVLVVAHGLLFSGLAGTTRQARTQQNAARAPLEPGRTVQQQLSDGETHVYGAALPADRYVELHIEQQGIELSVRVIGPDSNQLLQTADSTGRHEPRVISFITPAAGDYDVRLSPAARHAEAGGYVIALTAPRAPSADERRLEDARVAVARARALIRQGKYSEALPPAKQSIELRESVLGPDHPLVADSLHLLAEIYDDKGDYAEAEPVNLRALAIREKALGPDHQDVARSLHNLAWIYLTRQQYAKAEATYQRALTIQERIFGESHRTMASTLNDLAILYEHQGDYEKSITVTQRVLAIRERISDPDDDGVALALNNLGLDYFWVGDYTRAEQCLQRALQFYEDKRGPNHPMVATASNNLALVYENKGDYPTAERLHLRALAIDEAVFGADHLSVGHDVNNLARLYEDQKDYEKAGPLWRRALAIREKALGSTHSEVGEALNNLANFYVVSGTGRDEEIVSLLERSRAILERALGPDNVKVAAPVGSLARFYQDRGRLDQAEPLYQRSLEIEEKALGPEHPKVAAVVGRLAATYQAKGDTARALEHWARYSDIRERIIAHNVPIGSDRQKLAYLSVFADDIDKLLSFHAQSAPDHPVALRLAVATLLRRKGRALDATADTVDVLRAHAGADERALFTSLAEWRARLANLSLRGPDRGDETYRERLEQTSIEVERIEADISARSAEFRSESRTVTLEAVQSALPGDAALIEFARYHPGTDRNATPAAPRYSAYVVFASGRTAWVDLGDASSIERLADAWRAALRDPRRTDVRELGRALDERLMRPIRARLGDAHQLLVSPDGPLHMIPFAALVDEQGRYLVERYAVTYLTSGRDLLRLQVPRKSRSAPVVVADPAFGSPALVVANGPLPASRASVDYSQMFFGPLPGVAGEVAALRALLPQASFLTKERATKAALAQVAGPEILHIATHGFFLQDAPAPGAPGASAGLDRTRLAKVVAQHVENPLLRSGLALAGANAGAGSSDGILTALEAAGLDLWGTELVVLSACDTGVGEIKNGDGVYGLRRALVLAGSESQMISLWPVSDTGTRDLVVDYYTELLRGSGRGDALRRVQQKMLRSPARAHPYFWASFILSGQWAALDSR